MNITFHEGNTRRRVKYNQKDFDVLVVSFTLLNDTRLFEIPVECLPDKDSLPALLHVLKMARWLM